MTQIPDTLPLFPLQTVLFPEGRLALKVFEARYIDMVSTCLREDASFGVCLIAAGSEVGEAAVPHPVGTEARIVNADSVTPGLLDIVVSGARRFRLVDHAVDRGQLLRGDVVWLPDAPHTAVPAAQANLIPLLRRIVKEQGARVAAPYRFDDAAWVGARYAEVLPIPELARQKLLELDDVVSRLEIVQQYLDQRGLLAPGAG